MCFLIMNTLYFLHHKLMRLLVAFGVVLHDVHPDNYHVLKVMGRG